MVLLEPRVKQPCEVNCQCDFLDIFKKNANSRKHNHQMLQSIPGVLHKITVINHSPKKVSNHLINELMKYQIAVKVRLMNLHKF